LYVTHNRDEVDAVGERVVTITEGRSRESGWPRAVLDAPRSVALAQAAGFENVLRGRVVAHNAADGVMRVSLGGDHCELEVPLGSASVGETVDVAIRAGDIMLAKEQPRGLSARNIFPGVIDSIETRGTIVALEVSAGVRFHVHVTPGAVRSLQLKEGLAVWLVLKTHSCHVVTRP
jgi:molybdate transport system ATP-binding protein